MFFLRTSHRTPAIRPTIFDLFPIKNKAEIPSVERKAPLRQAPTSATQPNPSQNPQSLRDTQQILETQTQLSPGQSRSTIKSLATTPTNDLKIQLKRAAFARKKHGLGVTGKHVTARWGAHLSTATLAALRTTGDPAKVSPQAQRTPTESTIKKLKDALPKLHIQIGNDKFQLSQATLLSTLPDFDNAIKVGDRTFTSTELSTKDGYNTFLTAIATLIVTTHDTNAIAALDDFPALAKQPSQFATREQYLALTSHLELGVNDAANLEISIKPNASLSMSRQESPTSPFKDTITQKTKHLLPTLRFSAQQLGTEHNLPQDKRTNAESIAIQNCITDVDASLSTVPESERLQLATNGIYYPSPKRDALRFSSPLDLSLPQNPNDRKLLEPKTAFTQPDTGDVTYRLTQLVKTAEKAKKAAEKSPTKSNVRAYQQAFTRLYHFTHHPAFPYQKLNKSSTQLPALQSSLFVTPQSKTEEHTTVKNELARALITFLGIPQPPEESLHHVAQSAWHQFERQETLHTYQGLVVTGVSAIPNLSKIFQMNASTTQSFHSALSYMLCSKTSPEDIPLIQTLVKVIQNATQDQSSKRRTSETSASTNASGRSTPSSLPSSLGYISIAPSTNSAASTTSSLGTSEESVFKQLLPLFLTHDELHVLEQDYHMNDELIRPEYYLEKLGTQLDHNPTLKAAAIDYITTLKIQKDSPSENSRLTLRDLIFEETQNRNLQALMHATTPHLTEINSQMLRLLEKDANDYSPTEAQFIKWCIKNEKLSISTNDLGSLHVKDHLYDLFNGPKRAMNDVDKALLATQEALTPAERNALGLFFSSQRSTSTTSRQSKALQRADSPPPLTQEAPPQGTIHKPVVIAHPLPNDYGFPTDSYNLLGTVLKEKPRMQKGKRPATRKPPPFTH